MSQSKSKANNPADLGQTYLDTLPPALRKERGAYYTPPALARTICATAGSLVEPRSHFLDPACGAGAFLCAAREQGFAGLFGADIDAGAVDVARRALQGTPGLCLAVGDSLAGLDFRKTFPEAFRNGGFDLVATNPPYVRADRNREVLSVRRELAAGGEFRSLRHRWDLAAAFIERSLGLLRPGGIAAFLLPASYLRAEYGRAQHDWLRREHQILDVRQLSGSWFQDAAVASAILLVRAGRGGGPAPAADLPLPGRAVSLPGPSPNPRRPGTCRLQDLCFISYGLRANSDERRYPGAFVTADLLRDSPDPTHSRTYTEGKDLGGFRILRTRYLEWGTERAPGQFARRSFPEFLDAKPKILALCISGRDVRAALDYQGHAFNHTAIGIVPWRALAGVSNSQVARAARGMDPSAAPGVDLRYLLAVLHSRQTRETLHQTRRSDKHIYPGDWRGIGVPLCQADLQAAIGLEVDRARALPYPSAAFEAAVGRIQALVDEAFGSTAGR